VALHSQICTTAANDRVRREVAEIMSQVLVCVVVAGLIVACGPIAASVPPTRSPSQAPIADVALPPEWTATSRPTSSPTLSPAPSHTHSLTPSPEPSATDSQTPTPVIPTITPDLGTPRGVVQAAFSAYIARDESRLRELYDDNGREFCRSIAQSMLYCISHPYRKAGLSQLVEWWLEPPSEPQTSSGDFISLYSRWRNSDSICQQDFYLEKHGGFWLIHDHSTDPYGCA